jgi:hypothetical protein
LAHLAVGVARTLGFTHAGLDLLGQSKKTMGFFRSLVGRQDLVDLLQEELRSPEILSDPTHSVRQSLTRLVGNNTLTILIDDLDRCSPQSAVALMDQLRWIVQSTSTRSGEGLNERHTAGTEDVPNIDLAWRFVVAVDRGTMLRSLESKFSGIQGYDSNRYLEKIFPIQVRVPSPSSGEMRSYVNQLLGDRTGAEELRDALSDTLSQPVFGNPRLAKLCINRYLLFQAWSEGDSASREPLLAEWLAACARWPVLRRLMQRFDRQYWAAMGVALHTGTHWPGPEAEGVTNEPGLGDWLRAKIYTRQDSGPRLGERYDQFNELEIKLVRHGV